MSDGDLKSNNSDRYNDGKSSEKCRDQNDL